MPSPTRHEVGASVVTALGVVGVGVGVVRSSSYDMRAKTPVITAAASTAPAPIRATWTSVLQRRPDEPPRPRPMDEG